MKFSPELMTEILNGNKTVTRRPFTGKRHYAVGRDYTATDQPRWKKTENFRKARIRMVNANEEPLMAITEEDARKEGFKMKMDDRGPKLSFFRSAISAREQFYLKWGAIYGPTDPTMTVTRFEFKLVAVLKA